MTGAQITRLCRLWQKRLRLSDWAVTVELVPEGELPEGEWAHNDWEDEEMWSKVRILAGLDDRTTERHLVHELLHLRLDAWEAPYGDSKQEMAVNLLADCFLAAYPRRARGAAEGG